MTTRPNSDDQAHLTDGQRAWWIDIDVDDNAAVTDFLDAVDADRALDASIPSRTVFESDRVHLQACDSCRRELGLASLVSTALATPVDFDVARRREQLSLAIQEFERETPMPVSDLASRPKRRWRSGIAPSSASTGRSGAAALPRFAVGALALAAVGFTAIALRPTRSGILGAAKSASDTTVAAAQADVEAGKLESAAAETAAAETEAAVVPAAAAEEPVDARAEFAAETAAAAAAAAEPAEADAPPGASGGGEAAVNDAPRAPDDAFATQAGASRPAPEKPAPEKPEVEPKKRAANDVDNPVASATLPPPMYLGDLGNIDDAASGAKIALTANQRNTASRAATADAAALGTNQAATAEPTTTAFVSTPSTSTRPPANAVPTTTLVQSPDGRQCVPIDAVAFANAALNSSPVVVVVAGPDTARVLDAKTCKSVTK